MSREQLEAELIRLRRKKNAYKRTLVAQQKALEYKNERIRGFEQQPPLSRELQDITTGWRIGKWIVMVILIAVIGWSVAFWANSCAYNHMVKSPAGITVGKIWVGG